MEHPDYRDALHVVEYSFMDYDIILFQILNVSDNPVKFIKTQNRYG